MEETPIGQRFAHRPQTAAFKRAVPGAGSHHRGFPATQPAGFGRLSVRAPAHNPASDPFFAAPLSAAAWDLTPTQGRGRQSSQTKFKRYPIGYFHIDIAEVQSAQGRLYLFVAIDRTSKFAYLELHSSAGKKEAAQFLHQLLGALPYAIHTVLTDNGIQFTNRKQDKQAFEHLFDRVCRQYAIEHRLTQVKHPWTNG
jgi:hypothetical protein